MSTSRQILSDIDGFATFLANSIQPDKAEELRQRLRPWLADWADSLAQQHAHHLARSLYPFGGLDELLGEIDAALRAHGDFDCHAPAHCGPLGCLLAKIHHVRVALRAAATQPPSPPPGPAVAGPSSHDADRPPEREAAPITDHPALPPGQ